MATTQNPPAVVKLKSPEKGYKGTGSPGHICLEHSRAYLTARWSDGHNWRWCVHILELPTGRQLATGEAPEYPNVICPLDDGTLLLSGAAKTFRIEADSARPLPVPDDFPAVNAVVRLGPGRYLGRCADGLVSFDSNLEFESHGGPSLEKAGPALLATSSGIYLAAVGSKLRELKCLSPEGYREQATIAAHKDQIMTLLELPGGRIASGSFDKTVKIWQLPEGREVGQLKGHKGALRGLALEPSGRRLATACNDKVVRLFDLESGEELAAFTGHSSFVTEVAFDGPGLWSVACDLSLRYWELP